MDAHSGARSWPGTDGELPPPASYTRRTTGDRDEAEQIITELYLPNRLDLSRGAAPSAWKWRDCASARSRSAD